MFGERFADGPTFDLGQVKVVKILVGLSRVPRRTFSLQNKVGELQLIAITENDGPFYGVPQFADVAGPGIALQLPERIRIDGQFVFLVFFGVE